MKDIIKYLETRIGRYSVYFEDLTTGKCYGYNEKANMTAAGCMKLIIAMSAIKSVQDGKCAFLDKVKIEEKDKVYGTGILHEFDDREYTFFELIVVMLIQSDNTAANKIIDIIGMDKIRQDIKDLGLENTELNRKTSDERYDDNNVENITCAHDLSKVWESLYQGKFLNKENSTMLIDILRRQQMKNKLALYAADDLNYEISSKTGDKKGVENDTALIKTKKGSFILTVLSMGVPNSVYGTVTLAKCGKMIIDDIAE